MSFSNAQREVIAAKALERGIHLTDEHWRLLELSYNYYRQHETLCTLRTLIKLSGLEKKKIYKLFPGNPIGEISKITGLPMPKEC
ncbi:MAG TPA: sulfurtransferase TusE [Peptococcaceae bacterium]|nr:MAG: Putative sulfite reductase subunit protein [Moorella sp. 60_41]HBT47635.1 sulfurtransferase TusE [Peptococcaceae bacterium]